MYLLASVLKVSVLKAGYACIFSLHCRETTLLVDKISEENDEKSALRVKNTPQEKHNLTVSESSIKKMRRSIGWKYGRVRLVLDSTGGKSVV
ncbi:hypothetical protein FKM82_020246 [Ascaphus truei]